MQIYYFCTNSLFLFSLWYNNSYNPIHNIHLSDTWATGCFTYLESSSPDTNISIHHQYDPTNPESEMTIDIPTLNPMMGAMIYITYNQNAICQDCENCVSFVAFDGIETDSSNNQDCETIPNNLDTDPNTSFYVPSNSGNTYTMTNVTYTGTPSQPFTIVVPENMQVIIDGSVTFAWCDVIMMSGSKMLVPYSSSSSNILNVSRSRIHGCTEMWEGITVEKEATINLFGSRILDAAYAIRLEQKGNASIAHSHFKNNYVGLYTPPNNIYFSGLNNHLIFGGPDTFSCPNVLLPHYLGQPISVNDIGGVSRSYGYAGIELHNVGYDFMLLNNQSNILFQNLNIGFSSYASHIQ